jgi:hypothetical protein
MLLSAAGFVFLGWTGFKQRGHLIAGAAAQGAVCRASETAAMFIDFPANGL